MHIERFACDVCQSAKPAGPGQGLLPDCDINGAPWEEVAVDLIGLCSASKPHGIVEFSALNCITTTTTNLVEIAHFEHIWLSWYPKPMPVIHENVGKFTGFAFQHLLQLLNSNQFQLQTKTHSLMPFESNASDCCNSVENTLACSTTTNTLPCHVLVDDALATAMHALRSTVSTMLQATPGGHAFSCNIFLNIPLVADWQAILTWREQLVKDALLCANKKHINFDCKTGQKVLKYDQMLQDKLKPETTGPFDILWVHSNRIVTILLRPGIPNMVMFAAP